MSIKKYSAIIFIFVSLLFSLQAFAGFREALSALQHRDAERMLNEVEKAVHNKNYDGIFLFIPTLHTWYYKAEFVPKPIKDAAVNKVTEAKSINSSQIFVEPSWTNFLSKSQQLRLAASLEKIAQQDYPYQEIIRQLILTLHEETVELEGTQDQLVKEKLNAYREADFSSEVSIAGKNLTHQDRLNAIKHAAVLGNKRYQEIYAQLQLGLIDSWDFKKLAKSGVVEIDKETAYKKLEDLAVTYNSGISVESMCLVGDAYRDGLFGRRQDDKEAYLWYLRGYVRGAGGGVICDDRIQTAYRNGWIEKYDKENIKNIHKSGNSVSLQYLDETQHPISVVSFQNTQVLPILQLEEQQPNYRLQVYANGKVKYATFWNDQLDYPTYPFYKSKVNVNRFEMPNQIMGEDEWMIKKSDVERLLLQLKIATKSSKTNFYDSPLCGTGITSFIDRSLMFGSPAEQKYLFRGNSYYEGPKYRQISDANFSVVLSIIEKYVPTQHLRCGGNILDSRYLACIAADNEIQKTGENWLNQKEGKN